MVALDDLVFAHAGGQFRLEAPCLRVAAEERVAVVGPSGSGKTTLLNLVAGIPRPQRGASRVGALRRFRAVTIGFVFQDFALPDDLTARENILHPCRISSALRLDAAARARAVRLAEACGLAGKLDRHPGALSQGEPPRVAICRALVKQPGLVLSDEATGNLDPDDKTPILDLPFAQARLAGASVLAVTRDHALLPRFDRVVDFAGFRAAAA